MVDLQTRVARACGAVAVLFFKNFRDVVDGKCAPVLCDLGTSIVCRNAPYFSHSLRVGGLPSFKGRGRLREVLCSPFSRVCAVAGRILRSAFSRPLGLNAGRLVSEPFGAGRLALDAHVVGNPAQVVTVLAGKTAEMGQSSRARRSSVWVLAPLLLAAQRVGGGACGTQAGAGIALRGMAVFAGFAREVKAFASSFGRLALRYSFHLNPHPASTMFIVAQAV